MSFRPFWQKHPTLLRIVTALMIIGYPILAPISLVAEHWEDVVYQFKEIWNIAIGRDKP